MRAYNIELHTPGGMVYYSVRRWATKKAAERNLPLFQNAYPLDKCRIAWGCIERGAAPTMTRAQIERKETK